jgi:hypothetical protein
MIKYDTNFRGDFSVIFCLSDVGHIGICTTLLRRKRTKKIPKIYVSTWVLPILASFLCLLGDFALQVARYPLRQSPHQNPSKIPAKIGEIFIHWFLNETVNKSAEILA